MCYCYKDIDCTEMKENGQIFSFISEQSIFYDKQVASLNAGTTKAVRKYGSPKMKRDAGHSYFVQALTLLCYCSRLQGILNVMLSQIFTMKPKTSLSNQLAQLDCLAQPQLTWRGYVFPLLFFSSSFYNYLIAIFNFDQLI